MPTVSGPRLRPATAKPLDAQRPKVTRFDLLSVSRPTTTIARGEKFTVQLPPGKWKIEHPGGNLEFRKAGETRFKPLHLAADQLVTPDMEFRMPETNGRHVQAELKFVSGDKSRRLCVETLASRPTSRAWSSSSGGSVGGSGSGRWAVGGRGS